MRRGGRPEDRYRLEHADCRRYAWPPVVDHIATDPPWGDVEAYRWLARFAAQHLRPGGSAIVQVGKSDVIQVGKVMEAAGLTYRWILSIG